METTNNYGLFKHMTGNRKIEKPHVRRLKKEMQKNPKLLEISPILVNENMFIIDGQHRFEAAKSLKMPIHYVKRTDVTLEDTRNMNLAQKAWKLMDFAHSYAEQGNKNYQEFISMVNKFPYLTPATIMTVMLGDGSSTLRSEFRNGVFEIQNPRAEEYLERLYMVQDRTGQKLNIPTVAAFLELFYKGDSVFEWEKFITKLNRHEGAVTNFRVGINKRDAFRSIEDVYNFMSNKRERLY